MQLSSPDFTNGGRLALAQVNSRCGGGNRSPALSWTGATAAAKSFALTVFDPDAGGGRGFWHWIVFNIPATTISLPGGAGSGAGLPAGAAQADNDFGDAGYGGACPPAGSGLHHYEFTLYALGAPNIPGGKGGDVVGYLKAHALATTTLTGTYQR
jgi:hypothetical protein